MPKKCLAAVLWCTSSVWCPGLLAQTTPTDIFQKAPPHIDEALRARVGKFLQAHVDGKYRVANEVVADDSKDFYFAMNKQRYLSYDIVKIDYTDDFTKATVLATVEVNWRPSARFPNARVKAPYKTLWKSIEGEWFWYTYDTGEWETPFGKMKVGGESPELSDPAAAVIAQIKGMDGNAILNQIKASKTDIALKCYEKSSDTVEITNGMPGVVSLKLESSPVAGLEMKLDRVQLKQGETARLSFEYVPPTPQAKSPAIAVLRVEPIGHMVQFNINFAIPPELEKQLQKSR
jgi:hypothetical protein